MQVLHQGCHFDSGTSGLRAAVDFSGACPGQGLFRGIGGQDPEDNGNARLPRSLGNAPAHFRTDKIKMRGLPSDDGAQTDHGVELFGVGQLPGHQWDFKGPGDTNELKVLLRVFLKSRAQRLPGGW